MPESSTLQSLTNYAAPQLRKRIPGTLAGLQSAKSKYQRAFGQLTSLRHQNVEAVHEVHFDPPKDCYLVCERLEGDSLADLITRERLLPLETIRSITRQVASALTAAHDLRLMHGNLSPQAILVQRAEPPHGEGSVRIKVCDFGLGKPLGPELSGALGYLAPEQVDPKEPRPEPTPLSDQFALAVIAFELLAGRRAFPGSTLEEIAPKLLRQDPIYFQIPGISAKESDRIIAGLHKALSRLPAERYSNLSEFVAAIEGRTLNRGSRGSVIDPSRFAADYQGPIQIGTSVAQALVVAAQGLPGRLDKVRPGQDAQTLTLVRTLSHHSAQAATVPMMPRLDVQVNVNTTIATKNDNHVSVVVPPPREGAPTARALLRIRRGLRILLIGAACAAGVLGGYKYFVAERTGLPSPAVAAPKPDPVPPAPVADLPVAAKPELPDDPKASQLPQPPRSRPRPPRLRFQLDCGGKSRLEITLSQRLPACRAFLKETLRQSSLVLPYTVGADGHPIITSGMASGPPQLLQCLRKEVTAMNKSDFGQLPPRGGVLQCVIR